MKQIHINDLVELYNQYDNHLLKSKTKEALAMLTVLKRSYAAKSIFNWNWEVPNKAHREFPNTNYWSDSEERVETIFKHFIITIDKGITKKSLNMFTSDFVNTLFIANGIMPRTSNRNKPKLVVLNDINLFTVTALEKSIKPNTLNKPDLEKIIPNPVKLPRAETSLLIRICNALYLGMRKNKGAIMWMLNVFGSLAYTPNIPLFAENCYVGDNQAYSLTDNLYRYCATEKSLISIHLLETITVDPYMSMRALYYLSKSDPLYKAIIAEKALFIDQLPAIEKTREILNQLGV